MLNFFEQPYEEVLCPHTLTLDSFYACFRAGSSSQTRTGSSIEARLPGVRRWGGGGGGTVRAACHAHAAVHAAGGQARGACCQSQLASFTLETVISVSRGFNIVSCRHVHEICLVQYAMRM